MRIRYFVLCLLTGSFVSARHIASGSVRDLQSVPVAIAAIMEGRGPSIGALTPGECDQLRALYGPRAGAPMWIDAGARPTADARDALALIGRAADEGLDPKDYGVASLQQGAAALEGGRATATDAAVFDTALSVNTLRYLRHVHEGRVDPRAIGFRMTTPADQHDFAAILAHALAIHQISDTAATLAPPLVLYRGLRQMLARYRALASDPTLDSFPLSSATVRPGEPYGEIAALCRRLVSLDDLHMGTSASDVPSTYSGPLVQGVTRFQIRHGLRADGVLGKETQAALRVPLSWRVRQIELALERLRWLPHLGDTRLLAVNIPMFYLWGWDRIPVNGVPSLGTGVIVGRAINTQTPVFVEEMRYIIFRPYWNIPPSILRHETLPSIERDPEYLERHDMEIVSGLGDNARQVAVTAESIAQLRRGTLRARQRPGPKNSLGLVKFVFPNDDNVYMHGTPAPELFSRARRDFSHGCVRVEDPVALAEWVLREEPGWTRERILAAMNASQSRRVDLTRPIQVILFYVTAVVMPEDGTIRFAEDIYGHDTTLDRALTRARLPQ